MMEKYKKIIENETRYETYNTDDAELLLVAYGSSARMAKRAMEISREKGLKVSLFRPITLCPFPEEALRQIGQKVRKVLVVEGSPGEMIDDVKLAIEGRVPVHLLGIWGRYTPKAITAIGSGIIFPERIAQEVEALYASIA